MGLIRTAGVGMNLSREQQDLTAKRNLSYVDSKLLQPSPYTQHTTQTLLAGGPD